MKKAGRTYEIKAYETLNPLLRKKVEEFRKTVSDGRGRIRTEKEEAEHREKYCSEGDIKKWILVFEEDNLIGMGAVFRRDVKFNGKQISLGGVGKMRVREDRRKKGVGSEIMHKTMDELSKLSCDIAFLCTNVDSFLIEFYKKYGFVLLKKPHTYLSKSGKRYAERDGMLAPIKSKKVFLEVMKEDKPFDIGVGNW